MLLEIKSLGDYIIALMYWVMAYRKVGDLLLNVKGRLSGVVDEKSLF